MLLGSIALVLLGLTYLFLAKTQGWPPYQKHHIAPKTQGTSGQNNIDALSDVKKVEKKSPDSKSQVVTNQTTDQVPISTAMSASLTRLVQENNTVSVVMSVSNPTDKRGRCVVTFTNPQDRPITKEFDPSSKAETLLCATDVPAYEFSFLGSWHVTGRYYVGDHQVTSEGDVVIK